MSNRNGVAFKRVIPAGNHSLIGDVDAPVAGVGAVAHRQEVYPVVAAAATEPGHLKKNDTNTANFLTLHPISVAPAFLCSYKNS